MSVTERLWPSIESLRQFQKHLPSTPNIRSMTITNFCTDIKPLPFKSQSLNMADASAVVTAQRKERHSSLVVFGSF